MLTSRSELFFRSAPQLDETTKRWRNEQCNGVCEFGGRLTGGGGGAKSTQKSFNLALTCEAIIKITFYMVFSPPHKNSKPEQRANETSNFFFASTRLMRCSPPSNMHLDFKKTFFPKPFPPLARRQKFPGTFLFTSSTDAGRCPSRAWIICRSRLEYFSARLLLSKSNYLCGGQIILRKPKLSTNIDFFSSSPLAAFFSVFLSSRQFLRFHTRIAWRGKLYTKEIFSSTGCFRARSERK